MNDNRLECNESIGPLRPMLYFGDQENPIPAGMLPPEAFPYENSLDIELALNFFVERVRALEKEKYSLEFALKSVLCDLIELNPAYCGPCHGCKDGKKDTPLLCQAAMLEAYKEEAKEME